MVSRNFEGGGKGGPLQSIGMLSLCRELWNKSSAVTEMGNRGHNRHGPKIGLGAVRRIMQIMPLDFRFLMSRISNRVTPTTPPNAGGVS